MASQQSSILLSFIIPVYNVERYLSECVESILQEMPPQCEIVLVDDGASDRCPEICDRYAAADPRVKVIHKENGGLSSARNAGLAVASGEYVTFVDSDDKIYPEALTAVLDWIRHETADLCFLGADKLYADGTRKDLGEGIDGNRLRGQAREAAIAYLASGAKYPGSAWSKLYKRSFLTEHQLHFPYDRRYSEDLGFVLDCLLCAERFDAISAPFYQYRQGRDGSITNRISAKNFYDLLLFITESVEKLTVDRAPRDNVGKYLMSFVAYEYSVLLNVYRCLPKKDRGNALRELKKNKWVLKYAIGKRVGTVSAVSRLLGVRVTAWLIERYRGVTER